MDRSSRPLPVWVPFALLAAAALYLALRWDAIPPAWVVHWNAAGTPNGWSRRSVAGVFELPLAGAAVVGLVEILSRVVTLQRDRPGAVDAVIAASAYLARATSFGLAVLFAFLAVDLPLGPHLPIAATLAVPLLVLLAAVAAGLARVAGAITQAHQEGHGAKVEGYHALYYSNTKDARLWVPKLSGLALLQETFPSGPRHETRGA
jgi:uncharacterized membrane protein